MQDQDTFGTWYQQRLCMQNLAIEVCDVQNRGFVDEVHFRTFVIFG